MGYKTHRAKIYAGSMIKCWLQFMKSVHVEINYGDKVGHRLAMNQILKIPNTDSRLLHPEFQFSYDLMFPADKDSFMKVTYLNDFVYFYNLDKFRWSEIQSHVKLMNHYIEHDETMKGRDFEYEDELKEIV